MIYYELRNVKNNIPNAFAKILIRILIINILGVISGRFDIDFTIVDRKIRFFFNFGKVKTFKFNRDSNPLFYSSYNVML